MPAPKIAVVSVCLDDRSGLQRTFSSLNSQIEAPYEWIVADGGSTDGTVEWLSTLDRPSLRWTSERDGGIYFGMNRALGEVRAEYVLFLNSGDSFADPTVLAQVGKALADAPMAPALLFGDCYVADKDGTSHLRRARSARWSPIGMPTSHQAMFFRSDAIRPGFDTRYRLSADYAAVLRLYATRRGTDFMYLPIPLCRFELGGRSEQQRAAGLGEDYRIRGEVLGMNFAPRVILHAAHHVQGFVKRQLPSVHRLLRYR